MSFYNYVLFKPESQIKFGEILDTIENYRLNIDKYYSVDDWKKVSELLYVEQFRKNTNFELSFESLAYIINNLFGNRGIICTLKKEDSDNTQDFVERVLKFKQDIRKKYCKKDEIILVANVDRMPIDRLKIKNNGKIRLIDSKGQLKEILRYREEGLYKFHSLSYIHCPDAEISKVYNEMELLHREGILIPRNELTIEQLNTIRTYRTFNIENTREENFER